MHALSDDVRRKLMGVSVPAVVSLLWRNGYKNTMLFGPRPVNPNTNRFVGTAFTVRTIPVREDFVDAQNRGDRPNLQAQAVAEIGPGEVLVVAMDGETRTAFMGDIMSTHLAVKGVAAVVTDGSVSDAAMIATIPLPVIAGGNAATTYLSHRYVTDLNVPVGLAGVAVCPGDVLMGDANGVVVIPADMAETIADLAVERELLEEFVLARVKDGAPLIGTYPPNEETLAAFEAWRKAEGR
ncbi:ribonuclease activity regulator RraA [Acuticoccus sediminis]|uniref:Ribonuclease activity regulator RraA n=1 Tax=Acuticoccus sediminis TaxID=2184697 RepID=A0A8B2NSG8_9HYPH|nr:ribonuclease activity regulator RraA [Acuticoccus sediminis]RAI00094.1 ribonuclease activity regulator RraA [Acuticoccus sediminis]